MNIDFHATFIVFLTRTLVVMEICDSSFTNNKIHLTFLQHIQ